MIDSWTIAKGLLLYAGIVFGLVALAYALVVLLAVIRAAIYLEDRRAEKERAEAEERGRAKARAEADAKRDEAFQKSALAKAAREFGKPENVYPKDITHE
jgi:hypothetical protein